MLFPNLIISRAIIFRETSAAAFIVHCSMVSCFPLQSAMQVEPLYLNWTWFNICTKILLKEHRCLFGASVLALSHSLKITGSQLPELWVLGSKFTSYSHSYFWRGAESIDRRGERPNCGHASFLSYFWLSKLSFASKALYQMIEFPTNRGNAAPLVDFWWHCYKK